MNWVEPQLLQFCQDLGVEMSDASSPLIQIDFEHSGTLQIERYGELLTLWLAHEIPWHQGGDVMVKAMSLTFSGLGPELPLRCGWLGDDRLLLFVTLDERCITLPLLHQAFCSLLKVQREVLAS
ncbi:type III secretion chaperone SycN [Photorhabdus heterorhabditis]|uniref:type III secretion chaperone SycN n=1 Tax=Photorhabdus heterorhabditis TaxID=880156 RepID=UPI0015629AE0|nr:type III secretion chaperone SycN [Photorhabdus heterorhabditis]NRN30055.1 type III secretion chaperone SycN [Photorhabdus heterorhabditis subsp. aluminescens]